MAEVDLNQNDLVKEESAIFMGEPTTDPKEAPG